MSSSTDKTFNPQNILKSQSVIYLGIAWCVSALIFFLLFSIRPSDSDYPLWYSFGTYIFESVPFLCAAFLCYRNWNSPQIASGRNVWLGIGSGMICFFIGNIIFGWWELYFGLDPEVSPADFFYLAFYVAVGWGMFLAVLPRRLNLVLWQWVVVGCIAILGIALAALITIGAPSEVIGEAIAEAEAGATLDLPGWVIGTENFLVTFARPVNLFYIVGDVILLIIAATLLLAFWGGRFSQSWRMIAAATIALYIADMGFKYQSTYYPDYESGGILDIFYIFSGVLFMIGTVMEYDISSSRPARSSGSRRKRTRSSS
ncbi:MAG: hypothetical protein HC799_04885 [Limnothrix sp. RL_2_0]|nr:hypothetical protein [Limnothrix sp. RL_2_0]